MDKVFTNKDLLDLIQGYIGEQPRVIRGIRVFLSSEARSTIQLLGGQKEAVTSVLTNDQTIRLLSDLVAKVDQVSSGFESLEVRAIATEVAPRFYAEFYGRYKPEEEDHG